MEFHQHPAFQNRRSLACGKVVQNGVQIAAVPVGEGALLDVVGKIEVLYLKREREEKEKREYAGWRRRDCG